MDLTAKGAQILTILILLLNSYCYCNIHRAIPGYPGYVNAKKLKESAIIDEEDDELTPGFLDRIYQKASVTWLYAIPAAALVGATGIFPLLIFRVKEGHELKEAISPAHLRLLLSFAVGGLLGDVFLHLLPETWMFLQRGTHDHTAGLKIGLWVLAGLLCFLILEKIFFEEEKIKERTEKKKQHDTEKVDYTKLNGVKNGLQNGVHKNGVKNGHTNGYSNGHANGLTEEKDKVVRKRKNSMEKNEKITDFEPGDEGEDNFTEEHIKIIGYLNLFANCIDNFTHGLAVAGSFIVSVPVGVCTTFAILIHEIPHEIGDFAILLRAGFKRWEAAKGQLLTASGAVFGCLFGLLAESAGDSSAWVLPFTSGGFIYIALVTVVPDLLKEDDFRESLKQITALFLGIGSMGIASLIH